MALAVVLIIGFFAFVYRRLRAGLPEDNPLPPAFLLASARVTTTTMVAVVMGAVLVQHVAPVADASTLSAFYSLWDLASHTAPALAMAAALLIASAAAVRTGLLPRWTTRIALLASVCALVDVVEDLTSSGNNLGPLGLVAFALANVWIVGVAIASLRRPRAESLAQR